MGTGRASQKGHNKLTMYRNEKGNGMRAISVHTYALAICGTWKPLNTFYQIMNSLFQVVYLCDSYFAPFEDEMHILKRFFVMNLPNHVNF